MADHPTADELARWARTAVRTPGDATLAVDGARPESADDGRVGLSEVEGFPAFRCRAGSGLAAAARAGAGAVLVVRASAALPSGMLVRVSGSLVVAAVEPGVPAAALEVRLVPLRVSVHAGEADAVGTEVPLSAYDRAEPVAADVRTVAAEVLAHSRACHGPDLLAWVVRRHGLAPEDVAAAELSSLDERGAVVSWVDVRGAHRTEVPFREPVGCPHALADALRTALDA
ncbi:hypothetical protein [Phycicoccus avicenniae]|uniref:hypothetical protein n=1 Tax=Phycicoccus avicenniae TaxID=2828860 RepID=UPI003D292D2D